MSERYTVRREFRPTATKPTIGWAIFDGETGRIAKPEDAHVFPADQEPEARARAAELNSVETRPVK